MTKRQAFTLVELLVVISIIAVLLAVLMPALNKAKEQAKLVVCRNNMHQIGVSYFTYAENNSGKLPPENCEGHSDPWWTTAYQPASSGNGNKAHTVGLGLLEPVFKTRKGPVQKLFICPSDYDLLKKSQMKDRYGTYGEIDPYHQGSVSYITYAGMGLQHKGWRGVITNNAGTIGTRPRDKVTCAQAGRAMIGMCTWRHGKISRHADWDGHPWNEGGKMKPEQMAKESAGMLFLDGHAIKADFGKYSMNLKNIQPSWYPVRWWAYFNPWSLDSNGKPVEMIDSLGG